ncbi:hypothetical protein [Vibrio parahaemolyticus]|uniref:Transposase n=1 Tax=Vibrio phage vB_ValM-yong1 TaxID=2660715 RepID=A0A6M3A3G0_9CAUD|nr:hypothetical protein [Vibrio parahaemolyticus]YP_009885048.1 transposase [Vibrio phage Valm-yong1]HCZ9306342.1 hypothetical protein [Vibrio alginolyticus]MBM5118019.1 hypothetical protein [Vibrio parahaemolyticus]MBM5121397.1 hypothetical protein [Vibrio parahaemolyticus]MBM5131810.1 hypothetical protein [Vibrio parahaemolyticus]MBM5138605.1 hypothetical protein [Vibrio parahaemolyticus]
MRSDYIYELDGHKGQSAIAKAFGVPLGTLKSRLRNGKTIREAVHFVDGRENNCGVATHEWKGIKGVNNIAKAIGTTHTTIYKHLTAGCTIDEAVAKVQKSHKRAEQVRKLRAKSTAKPIEQVGIKKPTEVPELWRLALDFGG